MVYKKERIKDIIFIAPCLRSGGAERVMTLLANGMISCGYTVSFLLTMDQTISYKLNEKIKYIINTRNRGPLGQIFFIRRQMKQNRGAIFISFFTYQNIYSLIAARLLPCKVIVSERNDPRMTVYGRKSMDILRKLLYHFADGIVFQTQEAMNYFSKGIRKKGHIISNPLMSELPDIYNGNREQRIVAIARLNKQKNLPMMIRGIAGVLKSYESLEFELYGEGDPRDPDMRSELQSIADELGIGKRVHFMGYKMNVIDLIQSAAAYVNSSDYEGISNSMLEAIALGIPCVCTDCPVGGARMFIKDGVNGYLVPVGNEREFSNALFKVLSDARINVSSRQEAECIRERLSIDKIVQQWINIM